MWKIDFFLSPSKKYSDINSKDAIELEDVIKEINKKDVFYVPYQFYETNDEDNVSASDFLYGSNQNDMSTYIMEVLSKQKSTYDTYELINIKNEKGYVSISEGKFADRMLNVKSSNDIVGVKRFFLVKANGYDDYVYRMNSCFPNLVFHLNASQHIKKLGKIQEVKIELTRHLAVLNDFALEMYFDCNQNEELTLRELKSKHNIICSGKGSNEETTFKLKYGQYDITCNPHTKLFEAYTDQRIYFCWGRYEIENHKIIIARIGNHWS